MRVALWHGWRGAIALGALAALCACEQTVQIGGPAADSGLGDADARTRDSAARDGTAALPDPPSTWAIAAGGAGATMVGERIAVHGTGELCVAGTLQGHGSIGGVPLITNDVSGAFVAKLDANGAVLWAVAPTGVAAATGVAAGPEGSCYVAGRAQGSVRLGQQLLAAGPLVGAGADATYAFVAKLDAAGSCVWAFSAATGLPQTWQDVAVDAAGNALFAGSVKLDPGLFAGWPPDAERRSCLLEPVPEAPNAAAIFVARLDAAGGCYWVALAPELAAESTSPNDVRGVVLDGQSNLYLTGRLYGDARFGATTLARRGAPHDLFLARIDAAGNFDWAVGGTADDGAGAVGAAAGWSVAVDDAGHGFVGGEAQGSALQLGDARAELTAGGFVARFGARHGELQWVASASGPGRLGMPGGVAHDGAGGVVLSAWYDGRAILGDGALPEVPAGARGLVVARADANGAFVEAATATPASGSGATGTDETTSAHGLARDARGNLHVTGSLGDVLDFGSGVLAPRGRADLFVWKLRGIEP